MGVKDMGLAEFGRKELSLAEIEMPGLMAARAEFGAAAPFKGLNINGSLHMTIQTGVLIETLAAMGAKTAPPCAGSQSHNTLPGTGRLHWHEGGGSLQAGHIQIL